MAPALFNTVFKASAPGSLMIMGEYAVLYGQKALVAAIDKRITVTLTPRSDKQIIISSTLGEYKTTLSQLSVEKPFEYILAALLQENIRSGCDIAIESEFSCKKGLGSSAAVTAACLATIMQWKNNNVDKEALLEKAKDVIKTVQRGGSGSDAAASIYGGVIAYSPEKNIVEPITTMLPLTVIFSGKKTTTTHAIADIKKRQQDDPQFFSTLHNEMGQLSGHAIISITQKDWQALGELFSQGQCILKKIGVCTQNIETIIQYLKKEKTIYGAKISGSGLGDCVIGLGQLDSSVEFPSGIEILNIHTSPQGISLS